MGVTKTTHQEGSGASPQKGDQVTIEYTGFLKDTSKPDNKGKQFVTLTSSSVSLLYGVSQRALVWEKPPLTKYLYTNRFDSSVGRGDFVTAIGVGQVIRGWDEGVVQMKVGEKATLDITSDFGYGARGFTGHIPPNADLIFDVHLKKIN
ncbi:fkbp-type peptidyl-prolyl cis-trans isomerase [Niveomyces insectorum RCEF 264]|uniref:peptidylprolyl isomerase n=1 Tax=Niveomyces insectorum RCEF 264 TaxID=1081102 RepID=A0A168A7X5_9HYPO|nr:fkbp-type peptidyl-prolyl cis-trans isomerase [Niveomyces insectorum RCEF 264]